MSGITITQQQNGDSGQTWYIANSKKDYAEDLPRNLYAVIYPGKFLTASVIEMGVDSFDDSVVGTVFWSAYEASCYTDRGIPDFARIRRFCSLLSATVNEVCESSNRTLAAVLVRTPPPAAAFASGNNPEFLQRNTFFEGFVVGMFYGMYPQTPAWYCHPNTIRALFTPEGEPLKMWASRQEETAAIMSMANDIAGTELHHEREAECVLAAAHHYTKFIQYTLSADANKQSPTDPMPAPAAAAAASNLPPEPVITAPVPAAAAAQVWGDGLSKVKSAPTADQKIRINAPMKAVKVVPVKKPEQADTTAKPAPAPVVEQGPVTKGLLIVDL